MKVLTLVAKNSMRHRLRTILTILGLALAVMAFGLIRTFINAWFASAQAAAPDRMITRHAVSLTFTLPIAYKEQLERIEGVEKVTFGNWFGGVYIDKKNFFPQYAVEHTTYFDIYPEFQVPADQFAAFRAERNAAIVGQKLADRYGWQIGDQITLTGTIYPGDWPFNIRGIYTGRDQGTDEASFFFRFDYIDERMKEEAPPRAGQVGWYALQVDDPSNMASIAKRVDSRFDNSWAETKTESEKEFMLSFVETGDAIIIGLRIISYLIIGVIMMVLINTMVMTGRERISEFAYMRTLGFRAVHIIGLILGESLVIAVSGGIFGMLLMIPLANVIGIGLSTFLPVFQISTWTFIASFAAAIIVGILAAIYPIQRALGVTIVDGLRVVD